MKRFLIGFIGLTWLQGVLLAAPSISYTSYFNNTHTLTNSTTAGTSSANAMVATNGITAGASSIELLSVKSIRATHGVLTHAGTVTLDFSTNTFQKLVLTGNVTVAFSNLETNRSYQLTIANSQATNCTYVLPAVTFFGYYPTNIVAGKTARWWFDVDPQTNSIVYATYAEQQ